MKSKLLTFFDILYILNMVPMLFIIGGEICLRTCKSKVLYVLIPKSSYSEGERLQCMLGENDYYNCKHVRCYNLFST